MPSEAIASEGEGGERGIRTPGPVTVNGFQDRRIRPLCHLSGCKIKGLNFIFQKLFAIQVILFQIITIEAPQRPQ